LSRFSHFRPSTGSSRLSPTQWWVKALRRNIAYLKATFRSGRRPFAEGFSPTVATVERVFPISVRPQGQVGYRRRNGG
jgi:hypothetical protein